MPIYYQFILFLFGNFPPWISYKIADYHGGSVGERLECWNCNSEVKSALTATWIQIRFQILGHAYKIVTGSPPIRLDSQARFGPFE